VSLPKPVLYALVALAVVWTAVIWLWPDATIGLTFDDAFYYFEIGQRMAAGEGSTFDGFRQTNGYHPLWLLPCTLAHLVLPAGDATVRLLLGLQLVMALCGVGLALSGLRWSRGVTGGAVVAAVVLFAWLLVPMVLRTAVNGLESAVVVAVHGAILGLCLRHGSALHRWPVGRRIWLGALLGLAILSRTDGALLTPLILLWTLPAAISERQLLALVPVGIPPTAVLAGFLVTNQALFHTPLQVSGELKRVPPGLLGIAVIVGCMLLALALSEVARRGLLDRMTHVGHVVRQSGFHAVFALATLGYYTGLQTFARQWYFAPAVLWLTVLLVAGALDLAAKARDDAPDKTPLAALLPVTAILVVPLLGGAVYTAMQLAAPETLAVRKADLQAAAWLDEHLPPGARVASWDAGLIGYHTDHPVMNLDGVVNDVAWLRAMRDGTAGDILVDEGVQFVVNHGHYTGDECTTITDGLERLRAPAPKRTLAAWPFEQTGRLNGEAWGRHKMAACVVSLQPREP